MLKLDRGRSEEDQRKMLWCAVRWPKLPVQRGFPVPIFPRQFPHHDVATRQKVALGSHRTIGTGTGTRLWPSDCWCWAHSRKSRNLQPREDELQEGVVEGRSRSDASNLFQFPFSALPSTGHDAIHRRTEERHHLRTSTEPPTTAARGRPQHVPRYEHVFGVQISR